MGVPPSGEAHTCIRQGAGGTDGTGDGRIPSHLPDTAYSTVLSATISHDRSPPPSTYSLPVPYRRRPADPWPASGWVSAPRSAVTAAGPSAMLAKPAARNQALTEADDLVLPTAAPRTSRRRVMSTALLGRTARPSVPVATLCRLAANQLPASRHPTRIGCTAQGSPHLGFTSLLSNRGNARASSSWSPGSDHTPTETVVAPTGRTGKRTGGVESHPTSDMGNPEHGSTTWTRMY